MSTSGAIWKSMNWPVPDRPERDHGEADHGRDDRDHRGQQVERLGHVGRDDVLLEQHLGPVGQRLEQAERDAELAAGPVRADPVLGVGGDLALDVDQVRHGALSTLTTITILIRMPISNQHGLDPSARVSSCRRLTRTV